MSQAYDPDNREDGDGPAPEGSGTGDGRDLHLLDRDAGPTGTSRLSTPPPLLLTTVEAAERLGIGRCTMQTLINEGTIRSMKIGHLRRVPVEALSEYIERESRG